MLTDEKIEEIAEEFLDFVGVCGVTEVAILERNLNKFARAILAEVKLEDMLKRENDILLSNKKSLIERLGIKGMGYLAFCENGLVAVSTEEPSIKCLEWQDYNNWKQTIEGGE